MKKQLTAISLCLSLVLTTVPAFGTEKTHWADGAINKFKSGGVISDVNYKFTPDEAISRAEFASIISKVMGYTQVSDNKFKDVKSDSWYFSDVLKVYNAGDMQGNTGSFYPEKNLTRQEASVVLAKAFEIAPLKGETKFSDNKSIADWSKGYVNALSTSKIINGRTDGNFDPNGKITRAEAVVITNKIANELIAKKGTYSKDITGNVVVNKADVMLKDMKIAGNLYLAEGIANGNVNLNNVKVSGNIFVKGGGENSVILLNSNVGGTVKIDKYDGKVRVAAEGKTSINSIELTSGAKVETTKLESSSTVKNVTIKLDEKNVSQMVNLTGNFEKVTSETDKTKIETEGIIKEITLKADTTITGNGKIENVKSTANVVANVKGVEIKGTYSNDKFSEKVVTETTSPSNSSGSTSANNSGSSSATSQVILYSGSLGTAGNHKITGLVSGKEYKVIVSKGVHNDEKTWFVKADGIMSENGNDLAPLTGTEIVGHDAYISGIGAETANVLANEKTYYVSEITGPTVVEINMQNSTVEAGNSLNGSIKGVKLDSTVTAKLFKEGSETEIATHNYKIDNYSGDALERTFTLQTSKLLKPDTYNIFTYVDGVKQEETKASFTITNVNDGKIILASGSLGTADNKKITGLTVGKKYKVEVGEGGFTGGIKTWYVRADGTMSESESDLAEMTGTEIVGHDAYVSGLGNEDAGALPNLQTFLVIEVL